MKLYYFPTSHWSRAVSLAIEELGLDCEREVIDITKNACFEPDYMRLNPRGVVPTLADGERIVWDSRDIARYLDERYADGRLWREHDAQTQAWITRLHDLPLMLFSYSVWLLGERGERSVDILADKVTRARDYAERYPELAEHYQRKASFFIGFTRRVSDDDYVTTELERGRVLLADLGERVAGRAWIGGEAVSFADCIAASVLVRLVDLQRLDDWHAAAGPLRAYFDRLRAWPAFRYVFHDDPRIPERLRARLPERETP